MGAALASKKDLAMSPSISVDAYTVPSAISGKSEHFIFLICLCLRTFSILVLARCIVTVRRAVLLFLPADDVIAVSVSDL